MTEFDEIQRKIDIKLAELRQQAHYAIHKYDYHHKNDELQIIAEQKEILNQVSSTCAKFLNEMQKFNKKLNDAKQMSTELEQLLMQLQSANRNSEPTTQQITSSPSNELNSHLYHEFEQEAEQQQQQQQHEMRKLTSSLKSMPPLSSSSSSSLSSCIKKKDKLKDTTSKKQLFPPS